MTVQIVRLKEFLGHDCQAVKIGSRSSLVTIVVCQDRLKEFLGTIVSLKIGLSGWEKHNLCAMTSARILFACVVVTMAASSMAF